MAFELDGRVLRVNGGRGVVRVEWAKCALLVYQRLFRRFFLVRVACVTKGALEVKDWRWSSVVRAYVGVR